ncbi:hypothetical protein [Streptomyces sp. H27-S2]|uniref:hypothetical protein n=1 Tax=Streptomyces antarcticus TaxID=2996458 RepID=UPI00226D6323|nr:hypothetical protein [Streptomyces sp. H27-S2]MCY0954842.1 hypothetical protein [Streptomyces sp. H27-S2]
MRKALTLSAIILASSMALGGATTAFAADAPAPAGSSSPTTDGRTTDGTTSGGHAHAAAAGLTLSASSAKPGASVSFQMDVPDGSTHLSVSSKALADVKMTEGRGGTAVVADVKEGDHGVSLTGTGPDGATLQATARLHVTADAPAPKPTPRPSTLNLSTDFGRPGDKVVVTVKTAEKNAFVKSDAFGGQVNLRSDGKGSFTGTATVAKDVKSGYYGVHAFAGGEEFDVVKFSTEAKAGPAPHHDVKPLDPSLHKTPKGSVNTGQAPAGLLPETSNA